MFPVSSLKFAEIQKPPAVMFLAPKLVVGGAESMLDLILASPYDQNFRPVVCCIYKPGAIGERLMERGITVYHSLALNRLDFRIISRLVNIIRREKISVVYDVMSGNNTLFYGLFASKITGIAFVNALHNARIHLASVMLLQCVCMKFSDRVIALTERHREFIARYYKIQPDKIRVVPNSVDINRFSLGESATLYRAHLNLPLDSPLIAIIATLRPLKAHEIFLQAARKVLEYVPQARFLVVGDGSERIRLELYAAQLGIQASVHFLGQRTDIPEILSCVDVSVLSSLQETFPISLLESMAASKPVVATNVGFLDELVQHEVTGLLVKPGDAEGLAEAIIRLVINPDLAIKMGAAGRSRVEIFSSVQQTMDALDGIISEFVKPTS